MCRTIIILYHTIFSHKKNISYKFSLQQFIDVLCIIINSNCINFLGTIQVIVLKQHYCISHPRYTGDIAKTNKLYLDKAWLVYAGHV